MARAFNWTLSSSGAAKRRDWSFDICTPIVSVYSVFFEVRSPFPHRKGVRGIGHEELVMPIPLPRGKGLGVRARRSIYRFPRAKATHCMLPSVLRQSSCLSFPRGLRCLAREESRN
jgi:hypothetical protein